MESEIDKLSIEELKSINLRAKQLKLQHVLLISFQNNL